MYSFKTTISIFLLHSLLTSTESEAVDHRTIIDYVNRNKSTWTARQNFPDDVTTEELKRRNGAIGFHPDPNFMLEVRTHKITKAQLPETFDAREQWPQCADVIGNIRDQGNCGSCWAFASSEVMTDRLCIATNGNEKFQFSPQDFLECCNKCIYKKSDICAGGYVSYAFDYWISGVVSGGDYGDSRSGCKPYSKSAYVNGSVPNKCNEQCQTTYKISYQNDKKTGKSVYSVPSNVQQIQMEIMKNGPVVAIYVVYEDFYDYKDGVYQHVIGKKVGDHAVKIIGWGTENGTPYWLIANSWGKTDWGALGGFFKILRGRNHCGIEQYIVTGTSSSSHYRPLHILFAFIIVLSYFKA